MWPYKSVTRKEFELRKDFFRVDEVLFPNKPFIVIEWTDRMEYALNNVMEDTEPFPYDLNDEEIIEEVKNILRKQVS